MVKGALLVAVALLFWGCSRQADLVYPAKMCGDEMACTRVIMVQPSGFSKENLMPTFRRFAMHECPYMQLGQLTIGTDSMWDFIPTPHMALYANPAEIAKNLRGRLAVARLLCVNSYATLTFREGNRIETLLLRGDRDTSILTVANQKFRIASMAIGYVSQFYVRAEASPSLDVARQLADVLADWSARSSIMLYIRTDQSFASGDGPQLDITERNFANVPADEYRKRPEVICQSRKGATECLLHYWRGPNGVM